jgi:nitrilase
VPYGFEPKLYGDSDEWVNAGDSAIVNPAGDLIAGPLRAKEEILYAEIDPNELRGSEWMLDVAGPGARPDVFQLTTMRQSRELMPEDDGARDALAIDLSDVSVRGI